MADDGRPLQRYFDYLDQTQSEKVLAAAIREAYADLFQINKNANSMTKAEVMNKFKTLGQGQYSESVLDKMAMTFVALCGQADFSAPAGEPPPREQPPEEAPPKPAESGGTPSRGLPISGLVYNIQLILPESRDPKVYDALFESLKRHLT